MNELLDAVKDTLDCANDSELADALGVSATRICNYRKGRNFPNHWMARRIARALNAPWAEVVALIRSAKDAGRRQTGQSEQQP